MATEQELKRNFCPFCLEHVNDIKCGNCGTEDLIPTPPQFQIIGEDGMVGGEALGELEEAGIGFDAPKSKLELDERAVQALLNDDWGFLTGLAGTGKTTLINEIARLYPNLMEVCATTGIAAVNLGTKTLHSTLKFFDLKSLENAWREQLLHMNLRKVRARKQKLLIDEGSMLGSEMLDLIMNAVDEINMDGTGKKLGVWITGDMAQLPPIKMSYAFKSGYWQRFEDNTIRLDKIWRQNNPDFIEGINKIRAGKGIAGISLLQKSGVHFTEIVDDNFEGTTLIPFNDGVDAYNMKRLGKIAGLPIQVTVKKHGKQLPEWEKNIPYILNLKIGAYVMILSNDIPNFEFVNGDCGTIESFDKETENFKIKLRRNGKIVSIGRFLRKNLTDKEPDQMFGSFQHYSDFQTGEWIIGKIYYHPLRLAYASTIHKSQGLSLDMVQIDTRGKMFSNDSMGYVSISRARTPEGLYLVGKPDVIGKKISMNNEVIKYV